MGLELVKLKASIAKTILQQLGGSNKLKAMLGAKDLYDITLGKRSGKRR